MNNLIEQVKQWHHERNLINGCTHKDQLAKLMEEVGELAASINRGKDLRDDIGDCLVVLINHAERAGVSLEECLQVAYDDIKDRKGKMIDGTYVKEADL